MHWLIERIIVGEDTLEIRHVIPLGSAETGRSSPGPPFHRLRTDCVSPTALLGQGEMIVGGLAVADHGALIAGEQPVPDAIGVAATGDRLVMDHVDSRGVRRTYGVSLDQSVLRLWRDHPRFDQRFAATRAGQRDGDLPPP